MSTHKSTDMIYSEKMW